MNAHSQEITDVLQALQTDRETGLKAQQVEQLREQYGENRLKEKKKKSMLARFADQFKNIRLNGILQSSISLQSLFQAERLRVLLLRQQCFSCKRHIEILS